MVFGWTTESSSKKFSVTDLEAGEHVVEVYHLTVSAQNGPLKAHHPYKTPKEFRKDPVWKNVKEHFYALTNKRWLFVNYDDRKIIESYDLSQCDVIAGSGSITFMNGAQTLISVGLGDNVRIVQMIKHLQSTIRGQVESQKVSTPSIQQPSEDPLKVLKIRFAKGEITKEEFEDMKKMLG